MYSPVYTSRLKVISKNIFGSWGYKLANLQIPRLKTRHSILSEAIVWGKPLKSFTELSY